MPMDCVVKNEPPGIGWLVVTMTHHLTAFSFVLSQHRKLSRLYCVRLSELSSASQRVKAFLLNDFYYERRRTSTARTCIPNHDHGPCCQSCLNCFASCAAQTPTSDSQKSCQKALKRKTNYHDHFVHQHQREQNRCRGGGRRNWKLDANRPDRGPRRRPRSDAGIYD